MPSNKAPISTVQPGPGSLPEGSVPPSALAFDFSTGSAALEAHISDPVAAHQSSAIATPSFTGETWSQSAGSVEDDLTKLFYGANARGYWVLDPNANSDADFSGVNALNNAVTAYISSVRKPALFLRAGAYAWTHPGNNTALDRVRILASGSVTISIGTTMVIGASTVMEGVTLSAPGASVVLFGGNATLRRVMVTCNTFTNSSNNNFLEGTSVTASGAISLSGNYLSCSSDTFVNGSTTVTLSGDNASIVGGAWTAGTLTVSGSNNTFLGVPFTGTLALGGSNNIYLRSGTANFASTLDVGGVANFATNVNITGNLAVTGTTTFGSVSLGNTTITGTLGVSGTSSLSNTNITGTLGVSGATTLGSTLGVTGTTTLSGALSVALNTTLSGSLSVALNETVGGTLVVTGATTLNSTLGVTGTTSVTTLNASGNVTLSAGALTVSANQTTLDITSSSTATLRTTKTAHDHPGSSSNRWKLFTELPLSDGTKVRWFSGEGDFGDQSQWCITNNAGWDPSPSGSGGQVWSKDNTGKESNVLRCEAGELFWYGRAAGAGTWNDTTGWSTPARGNVFIGDTLAARVLTSSATSTLNGLNVTNASALHNTSVTGTLSSSGTYTASGGIAVTGGSFTSSVQLTVNNSLQVKDNATIGSDGSGNLTVNGTITMSQNSVGIQYSGGTTDAARIRYLMFRLRDAVLDYTAYSEEGFSIYATNPNQLSIGTSLVFGTAAGAGGPGSGGGQIPVVIPFPKLPVGGELKSVELLYSKTGGANGAYWHVPFTSCDFDAVTFNSYYDSDTSVPLLTGGGVGYSIVQDSASPPTIDGFGIGNTADNLLLRIVSGGTGSLVIYGARVGFYDPGPRNQ